MLTRGVTCLSVTFYFSDLYVGTHDLRGPGWLNKLGSWVT